MALPIKVSARAQSQIHRAAKWWMENRPAAPGAVRLDIGEALNLISQQPEIGSPWTGARAKGVRRLLVNRIQYFIYYRVTSDAIEILAVWHTSRGRQPSL